MGIRTRSHLFNIDYKHVLYQYLSPFIQNVGTDGQLDVQMNYPVTMCSPSTIDQ